LNSVVPKDYEQTGKTNYANKPQEQSQAKYSLQELRYKIHSGLLAMDFSYGLNSNIVKHNEVLTQMLQVSSS